MAISRKSEQRNTELILRFVLAAAIIAAASWYLVPLTLSGTEEADDLPITMVTTEHVNLRSGPGISYEVLSVVPGGTEVAAATNLEAGFVAVNANGMPGWMSADYLVALNRVIAESDVVETAAFQRQPPGAAAESVDNIPPPEPTVVPTSAPVTAQSRQVYVELQPGEKWIEVNRTTRVVTLHNGDIEVATFDALIGKDLSSDGFYSTATGTFYVHVKEKSLVETPFAEGVFLTDFVGFDPDRSNGFHSPVRDEQGNVVQTGGTTTLGCVRLAEDDAIFLFNFAHIGMRVEVHD